VLTGQAGPDLLDSYETERRPHARVLIKKAVRVGWAMTGGQDRAAAVRRIALAAAVRSDHICQAMGSTATPRLKAGALQPSPRRFLPSGIPRAAGRRPDPQPAGIRRRRSAGPAGCHPGGTPRHADRTTPRRRTGRFLPSARPGPGADQRTLDRHAPGPGAQQDAGWIDVRLAGDAAPADLRAWQPTRR
jgi:3-(3-hydroxy-phenyl)propionate hydroxylase